MADKASKETLPIPVQVCPNCGHKNRIGILLCEKCGANLSTGQGGAPSTRSLADEDNPLQTFVGRPAASARTMETPVGSPKASPIDDLMQDIINAGSAEFISGMILRLEVEGSPDAIILRPGKETVVGRRDAATAMTPDIDLTAYSGYRMGVSRRHALLLMRNSRLELQDLGSSNGTMLNGRRLDSHQPVAIRDGDEIIFGKMKMRVIFQRNT